MGITRALASRRAKHGPHRPEITVIDMKDHVLGRAAAVIAKQLLLGRKITLVRCEQVKIAGPEIRNKIRYLQWLRKKKVTNPRLGPYHHRAPSEVIIKAIRAMVPRYTKRGQKALKALTAYEGVPSNVVHKGHRSVIPKAQAYNAHKPERPFTVLGSMCTNVGWKYGEVVKKAEEARIAKSQRRYERNGKQRDAWKAARKEALGKISKKDSAVLAKFGQSL